ncbi:MAG: hypothetical protein QOF51_2550, partial [Chloroflexota bacterium]|nr:hypothetical protein [Chloroflexota bacterium]
FGLAMFVWPGISLFVLVIMFGAYALVDGAFAVFSAIRASHENNRWWTVLLEGLVGIVVGVLTFIWPAITALALLYLIAAWALITGVLEIVAAVRLRRMITNEWLLGLAGALSIVFAIALVANPAAGALALVWLIGAYALVFGVLLIGLGFRLRELRDRLETQIPGPSTIRRAA